jgi:hypothetical protein
MKVIIAGGRDFVPVSLDFMTIQDILTKSGAEEVISGCCRGADKFGELCADNLGITIKRFPADWMKYGKSAGPRRNREMARYADAIILMRGGKGTADMRSAAISANLKILYDAGKE